MTWPVDAAAGTVALISVGRNDRESSRDTVEGDADRTPQIASQYLYG
jgi:hypothetical protein